MKKIHIILIVLIGVSIAAIMGTVADSSTYAGFGTAFKDQGEEFHVVGRWVKEKGLEYHPETNANLCEFYMVDMEGVEKKVVYLGAKPQDFEMSEQIVITGEAEGEIFKAEKILMKCPSKYNNTSDPQKTSNPGSI